MGYEMLMFAVDDERFLNLYGDKAARLSTTQSIHLSEYRRHKFCDPAPALVEYVIHEPWYRRIGKAILPWMWRRRPADDDADNANFVVDVTPPTDTEARQMQRNSTVLNIFSLIMFGGPVLRMTNLREVTVDRIVRKRGFEQYVNKMMAEWKDITLYVREQHFRSDLCYIY
jgi:hypothetical protein